MLFSSDDVAQFINSYFEPVWESVRPVPIIRIDFGNGNVVTRTLHGNIATYVCGADGVVLDVLPGIYAPQQYVDSLNQLRLLHAWTAWRGGKDRDAKLTEYHKRQEKALHDKKPAERFVHIMDMRKLQIESPIKLLASTDSTKSEMKMPESDAPKVRDSANDAAREIARWPILAEDTLINETIRREQIHAKLATIGKVVPKDIEKWLYREVLHADLEDPYLGLGKTLFADYPFAAEDARVR